MEFVAPLMLIGVLGVAIPVIIHLFDRRKARHVPFAAVDFLLGTDRRLARRLRIREMLLLALRVAACLAIPLALAKPFASCASDGPVIERGPQGAVIVLDNSFPASLVVGDETLFESGRKRALELLSQLGPEADVAVIVTTTSDNAPRELSRDHIRVRDVLRAVPQSSRGADINDALRRAAALLASVSHKRRTIYLFSPLAAAGFHGEPPWAAGEGPELQAVDLLEGQTADNLAVTELVVESDPALGPRGIRVIAEVANHGSGAVEDKDLQLAISGTIVAQGSITIAGGASAKKQFSATIPVGSRTATVRVTLEDDALGADNRRYLVGQLREEVRVLMVNGAPSAVRHDDELFYLGAALRPGDRGDSGMVLEEITVDQIDAAKFEDFDVVVLANVPALSSEHVELVAKWVRGGGGLFVTMGDNVDPDAYNQSMAPLLPQRLSSVVDTVYGAPGSDSSRRSEQLTKLEYDHPVFKVFGDDLGGLGDAEFRKVVLLDPTAKIDNRKVLARYQNGAAALIERDHGRGAILLLTSSIDRDWNDLCIHTGYLPFVQETVRFLARKQLRSGARDVLVGRTAIISVESGDSRLEIENPNERITVIEKDRLEGRETVRFPDTDVPGFYRVARAAPDRDLENRPESTFAVNIDTSHSNLARVASSDLPTGGSGAGDGAPAIRERRVELWHALGALLLLALLFESLLVVRG